MRKLVLLLERELGTGKTRLGIEKMRVVTETAAPARQIDDRSIPPALGEYRLGVVAMVTGLFMAIMDVQIVTSSLTQIQGGLSASADEISWVQTSYLIADVVMVPLSGTRPREAPTSLILVAFSSTRARSPCPTKWL